MIEFQNLRSAHLELHSFEDHLADPFLVDGGGLKNNFAQFLLLQRLLLVVA